MTKEELIELLEHMRDEWQAKYDSDYSGDGWTEGLFIASHDLDALIQEVK
jgi:hypothetical protein